MDLKSGLNLFQYTDLQDFLVDWFARCSDGQPTRLARWVARHVGCTPEQVFNLRDGAPAQLDQVPGLGRALGCSTELELEHLRRMVVLQNATDENRREARLSVWETHATGLHIPVTGIQDLLRRDPVPGAVEAMLLPTLALLRTQGAEMSPAALEPLLRTPVPPDALDAACTALEEGASVGAFRSARMLALAPPGRPESLSTVGWHGRLDLARDVQLRLRAEERTLWAMTWTADEPAERGACALLDRLEEALSEVVQATLGEPVRQLVCVQVEQVRMAEWLADDGVAEQSWPPSLRARQPGTKVPLEVSSPAPRADGRPCLYATTAFHAFAQEWIAWRKRRDKASSATWMGKQMGVSRSLAHALAKGTTPPRREHIPGLVRAYGLNASEAAYLEGLTRYALATDPEDKAREHHALLSYALAQGVRTLDGDRWRVAAHWAPRVIWALAHLPSFQERPGWVAQILGGRVLVHEAKELLEALLNTGLLVPQPEGPPEPAEPKIALPEAEQQLARFALHDSVLWAMQRELRLPFVGQRFCGWVLALPERAAEPVQAAVERYRTALQAEMIQAQERIAAGGASPATVLISANQIFPLTEPLEPTWTRRRRRR